MVPDRSSMSESQAPTMSIECPNEARLRIRNEPLQAVKTAGMKRRLSCIYMKQSLLLDTSPIGIHRRSSRRPAVTTFQAMTAEPLNVFKGQDALADYFNPDRNPMLPLVELPDALNILRADGIRIFAKMLTALPAHNVKSLPGTVRPERPIAHEIDVSNSR